MTDNEKNNYVTWIWVVGILLCAVGFLVGLGVNSVLGDTSDLQIRQAAYEKLTNEELSKAKERISILETKFNFIADALDEIKKEVKK